jgi:hypothetical protein
MTKERWSRRELLQGGAGLALGVRVTVGWLPEHSLVLR